MDWRTVLFLGALIALALVCLGIYRNQGYDPQPELNQLVKKLSRSKTRDEGLKEVTYMLAGDDYLCRQRAAMAMAFARIGDESKSVLPLLQSIISTEPDGVVACFAVRAISRIGRSADSTVILLMQRLSETGDIILVFEILRALERIGKPTPEILGVVDAIANDGIDYFRKRSDAIVKQPPRIDYELRRCARRVEKRLSSLMRKQQGA